MTAKRLDNYGHVFKNKVISSLLSDLPFLHKIVDVISLDQFESPSHKWIIEKIQAYYFKYNIYPTPEVMSIEMKKEENEILRLAIREDLKQVYSTTGDDIEYVKEEFFNFCKNQKLKDALLNSVDLLQEGEYESIRKIINEALKSGNGKDIGHEYEKDLEVRFREEENKKVSFPWKIFNDITDGGLGSGNLMILFAPPGIGKSTVVCNMAAHYLKDGKNVVYYTLELDDKYVGRKMDSILTGIDIKLLKNHRDEISEKINALTGKIVIKEYSPKRASLDTIESHLKQLKYEANFIPDVVIIDYPDLLKSSRVRKDNKQEVDDIYTELKGLAKDMKIPFVCPSQINRAGAKDDIIEGDKVAGSYDKMMIADLSVSLSRKRKDKINGTGRFHIMKSRLGPDGMTYAANIDLSRGFIEISEDLYDDDTESTDGGNGDFSGDELAKLKNKFLKK
jgi:replicative DNA helicase